MVSRWALLPGGKGSRFRRLPMTRFYIETKSNLLRRLVQVSSDQVREAFRESVRDSVYKMIVDALADYASEICGREYNSYDSD